MKHPCKDCLVKISCSKDCKEYKLFIKFWSQGMSFISFFIASLIIAPLMLYFQYLHGQGIEWPMQLLAIFWVICMFYVIAMSELNRTSIGIFAIIFFGPIFAISIFIMNRTKKWFWKYSVRA